MQGTMNPILSRRSFCSLMAAAVTLSSVGVFAAPSEIALNHASVQAAIKLQNRVTPALMKQPEVLGTAVGDDGTGKVAVIIYIDQNHPNAAIAKAPAGTVLEFTDKFVAMVGKPGGGGVSHIAKQTPPIQLGTSGGWRSDLANGYCCGGTLGSLFQVNGTQYILSNYHVFESDIVLGGNNVIAGSGDPVIQPGLIDVNCSASAAQVVGSLVKLSSLPNNNVDVGVAQASSLVRTDGAILEIGTISSQTAAASLNKAVKKSGRTTGLTHSTISGLNATISVTYENECAGGAAFTKTFTGQIVIANRRSTFLNSGDSGSLMVEDVTTGAKAVGLLFAGSSSTAIANPIGDVLTFVGTQLGGTATMVGN